MATMSPTISFQCDSKINVFIFNKFNIVKVALECAWGLKTLLKFEKASKFANSEAKTGKHLISFPDGWNGWGLKTMLLALDQKTQLKLTKRTNSKGIAQCSLM
jgi:hypothetical protein